MQYFYDGQIRRYIVQVIRFFSNFVVQYSDGTLVRVPVLYGDQDRQVANLVKQNSENKINSAPRIAVYVSGLELDTSRLSDATYIGKMHIRERNTWTNPDTGDYEYTGQQGENYTVERLMPTPYKLTVKIDIWTTSTEQKLQLLEQILVLFNPSVELQTTDNYIDWTSLSVVELESTQWTSRTIPMGTENPIDIATLKFNLPIWISSPAKVKKLGVIERVIASIYDAQGDLNDAVTNNDLLLGTRQVITPFNYKIVLIPVGNTTEIQILQERTIVDQPNSSLTAPDIVSDSAVLWPAVIGMYGVLRPGVSQIRLDQPDGSQVIGTIVVDPNDDRFVIFDADADTVPANTMLPIDAVINPLASAPGIGLPEAAVGQRYLLTEDTGSEDGSAPTAWLGPANRTLVARANDIIEFDGLRWDVTFMADQQTEIQYITNLTTGIQYEWTGQQWIKSYQGIYPGGEWSLVL